MTGFLLGAAMKWLLSSITSTINTIWKLLTVTLFHLPDVSSLPEVQVLTGRSLTVVDVGYGLGIAVAGLLVIAQPAVQSRTSAAEVLPRLVIGFVAANVAGSIFRVLVRTTNALVVALTGGGIASGTSWAPVLNLVTSNLTPGKSLLMVVIGLILCVLVVLLVVGWITRFFTLVLLCGVGPAALACHGSTLTDAVAQAWWRAMGVVCFTVLLQAVSMNVGLAVLLDPAASRQGLDLGTQPQGLLQLLIVLVLLWTTIRIPALVRTFLAQRTGRGPNVLATIVRVALVQQMTRGLSRSARQGMSRMVRAGLGGGPGAGGATPGGRQGPSRPGGPPSSPGAGPRPGGGGLAGPSGSGRGSGPSSRPGLRPGQGQGQGRGTAPRWAGRPGSRPRWGAGFNGASVLPATGPSANGATARTGGRQSGWTAPGVGFPPAGGRANPLVGRSQPVGRFEPATSRTVGGAGPRRPSIPGTPGKATRRIPRPGARWSR